MAKSVIILLLSTLTAVSQTFPATGKPNPPSHRTEKLSHFRFYWHDTLSGSNPTAITIVPPVSNKTSSTAFGQVNMIDDPLTEKPEPGSRLLGRAQGLYGLISQEEVGLMMVMSFVFSTGKYNGSTLMILGRNPVFEKVREMPVIGGSGLFRWARGYVQASTYSFDNKTGNAVVKYDVHVLHF
ncbi:hypothetical protein R6Q59_024289 [Mikania micrantha]